MSVYWATSIPTKIALLAARPTNWSSETGAHIVPDSERLCNRGKGQAEVFGSVHPLHASSVRTTPHADCVSRWTQTFSCVRPVGKDEKSGSGIKPGERDPIFEELNSKQTGSVCGGALSYRGLKFEAKQTVFAEQTKTGSVAKTSVIPVVPEAPASLFAFPQKADLTLACRLWEIRK
ncbi:hypothetical protein Bbelb_047200 [Branchiostoma belcheri]|nr:hypothetical protein Bbelb_047200 [Branchiostoma belcheri]